MVAQGINDQVVRIGTENMLKSDIGDFDSAEGDIICAPRGIKNIIETIVLTEFINILFSVIALDHDDFTLIPDHLIYD